MTYVKWWRDRSTTLLLTVDVVHHGLLALLLIMTSSASAADLAAQRRCIIFTFNSYGCGKVGWLTVSFLAHVNYVFRIVSYGNGGHEYRMRVACRSVAVIVRIIPTRSDYCHVHASRPVLHLQSHIAIVVL